MNDIESSIKCAMNRTGIPVPDDICIDGKMHRFPTNNNRSDRSGYYKFFDHGTFIAGFYGDWRSGCKGNFCSKDEKELTFDEKREVKESKQKHEEARRRMKEEGIKKARSLLDKAGPPDPNHNYLTAKGIEPVGYIKQDKNILLLPLTNIKQKLKGIQKISEKGEKRFTPGTDKTGSFLPIGQGDPFYICEGYATGASIYMAIRDQGQGSVIIAFDAGNLIHVGRALRDKYPAAEIIFCADNDQFKPEHKGKDNPGVTSATKAAKAIGAKLSIPYFKDTKKGPSDFNDLHQMEGLETVKKFLGKAEYPTLTQEEIESELKRLAALSPVIYDQVRDVTAKRLNVRVTTLDSEVKKRGGDKAGDNKSIIEEIEPWEEPVNGEDLLNEMKSTFQKHVILTEEQAIACSLWCVSSYLHDTFWISPILVFTSPLPRCGKTTAMRIVRAFSKGALLTSNISPAALYRVVDKYKPCLIIDEGDAFLTRNEELRGIIDAGYTNDDANVIRCNNDTLDPQVFSTWCPKVIALINKLPLTIRERAIEIKMERKTSKQKVERLRLKNHIEHFKPFRQKLLRWANENEEALKGFEPQIPEIENNRAMDNWFPLLAIAEKIGGDWPEKARKAMLAIEQVKDETSTKQELLLDIRDILDGREVIFSKDLVNSLINLEARPWSEFNRGKPLTQNILAKLLGSFGIKTKTIRIGKKTLKGYEGKQFVDVFDRYLPQTPPNQNVTTSQSSENSKLSQNQNVTKDKPVTLSKEANLSKSLGCYGVTLQNQGGGGDGINQNVTDREKNPCGASFDHLDTWAEHVENIDKFKGEPDDHPFDHLDAGEIAKF